MAKLINLEVENTKSVIDIIKNDMLEMMYPIGSVYISTTENNPLELFGFGEWEALPDRFLLGAGDTHSPGTTGGSQTHLHDQGDLEACIGSGWNDANSIAFANSDKYTASRGNTYKVSGTTSTSGGTRSHNTDVVGYTGTSSNMPPYLVVYMWTRVA